MTNKHLIILYILSLTVLTSCASSLVLSPNKCGLSPIEYGLLKAKTGEERYQILLKVHQDAVEKGVKVDYHGIDSIQLAIPPGGQSIPLGSINDFSGVVFTVTNKEHDIYLFSMINQAEKISVLAHDIDKGSFRDYNQLKKGTVLLKVEDQNPWVINRKGYSYGHIRRDIILISNGKGVNKSIMPYNNVQSIPTCKYYKPQSPFLILENITLNRAPDCTAKTFLCNIVGANNVRLKRVCVNTPPQSELVNDMLIHIIDCTNVLLEDVTVHNTYSKVNYDGYGFSLANIWNLNIKRLNGIAKWGIFGNNNINNATITDSEINRFDVHCYCKDISFKNVKFSLLYNQFSSAFGTISFENCIFTDFVPVLYESTYNAYSRHSLFFKECVFNITKRHNYLIDIGVLPRGKNSRTELEDFWCPQTTIKNMVVNVPDGINDMNLFHFIKAQRDVHIEHLDPILINGLNFYYDNPTAIIEFSLFSEEIIAETRPDIRISKLRIMPAKATDKMGNVSIEGKGKIYYNIKGNNLTEKAVWGESH